MKFIATTSNSYCSNRSLRFAINLLNIVILKVQSHATPVPSFSLDHVEKIGPTSARRIVRPETSLCKYCRFKACLVIQMQTNAVGLKDQDSIEQSDENLD
ncbi:hypothetical protein M3Y96_00557000 [Aphelenchoides besseyi]|nr:hypothetical protein M3Y96_00557000 [Aphelenchoides besseyi]